MRFRNSEASPGHWWRWWRMVVLAATICCVPGEASIGDEVTETVTTPLSGLFVRQETALQKLDALMEKVNKVDLLEAKIEELKALVAARSPPVEAPEDLAEEGGAHGLSAALSAMGAKLDSLSGDVRLLNDTVRAVGASVAQLDQRLDETLRDSGRREETSSALLESQAANFTVAVEGSLEELKNQLRETVENVSLSLALPSSLSPACEALAGIRESLARLEDVERPSTNATKHMLAAVLNRIRVSNVAMDKRLGAVLHTSSLRQRVLQDTLLAALASVTTVVRSETRDVLTGVDGRLQELLNALTAAAMQQGEDLAVLVQDAFNTTFSEASSSGKDSIESLVRAHENLTAAVTPLLALRNLTEVNFRESAKQLCVVPVAEGRENVTSYSVHPQSTQGSDMVEMKRDLDYQLQVIRDQLDGLRIYYDTSLHMHTNEVLTEVESAQNQVSEVVRLSLEKGLKQLEKLRRSSLGFLDAAVTSVSSSAVASAQATADQLKKELKKVAKSLEEGMRQVEAAVSSRASVCPRRYTYIGGKCLLAMPSVSATWEAARVLCHNADGGELALLPETSSLAAVTPFLFPAHDPATSVSFWVGGKSRGGAEEWSWVDGSPVRVEMSVLLPSLLQEEEEGAGGGSEECLALVEGGREEALLVATSCWGSRGALCQRAPTEPFAVRPTVASAPMEDEATPSIIAFHDNAFDLDGRDFSLADVIF